MSQLPSQQTAFGHPAGLFLLFGTELWERFSYYAMRAILVLYLADAAMAAGGKGLGWSQADAISLYGTFTMWVYITPLIGGWLADNLIGQRKAIIAGGILMAAGQFALGTPHAWVAGHETTMLYLGLTLLIIGNGLFKPNISTMVGDLYKPGDQRRDGAFTIFYMGINIGAFLSGIVVGEVVRGFGGSYQAGFICAGIGMVISLILQMVLAQRLLGDIGTTPAARRDAAMRTEVRKTPLTAEEVDRFKVILILGLFTIIFWAGFEQAGGLMNIYADRYTDRTVEVLEWSWTVPTTYFQSLNPLFIIIFAPVVAFIWMRLGQREPNSPVKFSLALVLLAIGFLCMVGAVFDQAAAADGRAAMWWLVAAYLFHTLGELCLSPIGLSMVTKLAPLRLASLMMGTWFLFIAAANKIAGLIGSLIGSEEASEAELVDNAIAIFGGIAVTSVIAAVILFFMANKLVYWMHGAEDKATSIDDELKVTADHDVVLDNPKA